MKHLQQRFLIMCFTLILLTLGQSVYAEPVLRAVSAAGVDGDIVQVVIRLEGDATNVAGLQFDLYFPEWQNTGDCCLEVSGNLTEGAVLNQQSLFWAHISTGVMRILIMPDLALTAMANGDIAVVNFKLHAPVGASHPLLTFSNLTLTTSNPNAISPVTTMSGMVAFNSTIDTDGDGITDIEEVWVTATDPLNPDDDFDGLPDLWERTYYGDTSQDGTGDYDNDGMSDIDEITSQRNPAVNEGFVVNLIHKILINK